MSDAKEDEEGGQGMPSAVEESQQLVDAEIQVQPEASNDVENGKAVPPSEDHIENGKAEPLAEDENVKPVMVEPPVEDNNEKPVKTEPPVEDKSVNPGKAELPAEDNTAKAGKVELPAEDNTVKAGKVELPAEDNTVKSEKVELPAEDNTVKSGKVELPAEDNSVEALVVSEDIPQQDAQNTLQVVPVEADAPISNRTECEASNVKTKAEEFPKSNMDIENDNNTCQNNVDAAEPVGEVKPEACEAAGSKTCNNGVPVPSSHNEPTTLQAVPADKKTEMKNESQVESKADEKQAAAPADNGNSISKHMSFLDPDHFYNGNESGTEEEQSAFMKELENFFRERSMEFKPPKFYGEGLNCLKLWRAVTRLGGYDKVTSCKLWRQVGESFKPPKTCTTVSWTFRGFYEKALLDYERHKIKGGELNVPITSQPEPVNIENQSIQASVPGRARRDAAARAMQGWHSQRLLGNGEVSDPIIKDRNSVPTQKREKQLKSINLLKRKKPSYMDNPVKAARSKPSKPQLDTAVVDVGPPADWVKVNVQKTKDCFEVYALVPGLLREEVRVQSDPAGRLVISGEPEHANNPWGVTPFKKVVSLPSRIDPHQTSAVVTLHGQLFVRVPFEQSAE